MIKINFNSGIPEPLTLVLSSRDLTHIGQLTNVSNINLTENLNAANELSFEVHKYFNDVKERLWDEIYDLRLIWVRELDEYFEITTELVDQVSKKIVITGRSLCECELSQVYLGDFEINTENDPNFMDEVNGKGSIFFDNDDHEHSIIHRVFSSTPAYEIGHIDSSLSNLQQIIEFQTSNKTVYDFLTNDLSEQFDVMFTFNTTENTYKRKVNIYDLLTHCNNCHHRGDFHDICPECGSTNVEESNRFKDTTVFVSTENLTDEVQFTTDVDSIKNCFRLEAGDDIMSAVVEMCNANGKYIYEFSPDMLRDMPQELRDLLESYDSFYNDTVYNDYIDLDHSLVDMYNGLCTKYNDQKYQHDEWTKFETTGDHAYQIKGYQGLIPYYYDFIDFKSYLESSMMPVTTKTKPTVDSEVDKLNSNLQGIAIGLSSYSSSTSIKTIENAILNYAKVFAKTGYVKLDISSSSMSGSTWSGKIKVTSIEDKAVFKETNTLNITINDDEATFWKQRIEKQIAVSNQDDMDLLKPNVEINTFKEALKKYSAKRLESFNDAFSAVLGILGDTELGKKGLNVDEEHRKALSSYMSRANNLLAKIKNTYIEDRNTAVYSASNIDPALPGSMYFDEIVTFVKNYNTYARTISGVTSDCLYSDTIIVEPPEIEGDNNTVQEYYEVKGYSFEDGMLNYEYNSPSGLKYTVIDLSLARDFVHNKQAFPIQNALNIVLQREDTNLYTEYKTKSDLCAAELNTRNGEILILDDSSIDNDPNSPQHDLIGYFESLMGNIRDSLDFKEYVYNHTEPHSYDLFDVYTTYLRQDTYSNHNYISDGHEDDNAWLVNRAQEFIAKAKKDLHKSAVYQHSISSNLNNLLLIPAFAPIINNFELGNWIRVEADGVIYRLRLISYSVNYDDLRTINTQFSDVTITADGFNDIESILNQSKSMASNFSYVEKKASKGAVVKDNYIDEWVKDGLNSALIRINNNNDEEISIDNAGIIAKTYDDIEDDYDEEQLRITHNMLAFTDDNWQTVKTALGKVEIPHHVPKNSSTTEVIENKYGLIAEAVMAGWVIGSHMEAGDIIASYLQNVGNTNYINLGISGSSSTDDFIHTTNFQVKGNGTIKSTNGRVERDTTHYIDLSGTTDYIHIGDNFKIDKNGVVTISSYVKGSDLWNPNTTEISGGKIRTGTIQSSSYNYTSGNFSNNGMQINLDGNGYIRSKKFAIDSNGNAYFSGSLSAATGTFKGELSAATGSFSGSITASSGTIGGFTIGGTSLTAGSGTSNIGISTGSVAIWCGGASSGAKLRISNQGTIVSDDGTNCVEINHGDLNIHAPGNTKWMEIRSWKRGTTPGADAPFIALGSYQFAVRGYLNGESAYRQILNIAAADFIYQNVGNGSDKFIKKNVEYLTKDYSKRIINEVYPIKFDYSDHDDEYSHYGIFAQDLRKVLDDIETKNMFVERLGYNGYRRVEYQELIPHLINCVQDLYSELQQLKEQKEN